MSNGFRQTAERAAREAGRIQRELRVAGVSVIAKGDADITTDVDAECERVIVAMLRSAHPEHEVLGEEGTVPARRDRPTWVIDPLDGTKNYAHGYPRSGVSIALVVDGRAIVGAVYCAHTDEMFLAERGSGATLNGLSVRVSQVGSLARAMVASAITYDGRVSDRVQLERLVRVHGAVEAVRSDGCAALDLCDVARGRFDAYFEPGLKPWDVAAGALIVEEAGGVVSGLSGGVFDPFVPELVASNGRIHTALLERIVG